MNEERIAQDVADFFGWKTYPIDRGLAAYEYIATQALEREFHSTACAAYLEWIDG